MSVYMWKVSPHGLILNTWLSAGDTVLRNYESFRRWSLTGGAVKPWGLTAQPHSLSLLSLFWHVKWGVLAVCSSRHGCLNLPSMMGFRSWAQISPPSCKLFSSGSFVPLRNITKTKTDYIVTHFWWRQPKLASPCYEFCEDSSSTGHYPKISH